MGPAAVMGIGAVTDYLSKQKAEKEARRQAAMQMRMQAAQAMGGNTYGAQAALTNRRLNQQHQPDNMSMLASYLGKVSESREEPGGPRQAAPPMMSNGGMGMRPYDEEDEYAGSGF